MIKQASINDENKILDYIKNCYYRCPYLYLDFNQYKFDNENVKTYIQIVNGKVTGVALIYYDGMHIFSKDYDMEYDGFSKLIENNDISMICGEKKIISKLSKKISNKNYKSEYGYVRGIDKLDNEDSIITLELASLNDVDEITKLILTDEGLGGSYTYDVLYSQIIDRIKENFGRSFILKDEKNKIIGHVSSGAESDKMVILTGLIVDSSKRGQGLGKRICKSFSKIMLDEGKKIVLIAYTPIANQLYEKLGFKVFCEWGKLYLER